MGELCRLLLPLPSNAQLMASSDSAAPPRSLSQQSSAQATAALLAAIKEPLPPAKRLTPREQAALSNRLYLSLDTEGRSLKERQQESAEKLQASYSGLFQPRSSHRARSPAKVRGAEQEAEGEGGALRLVSLCGRGEWTAVRQLLQASLDRGCHLLVGTPGRLCDLIERGKVSLHRELLAL